MANPDFDDFVSAPSTAMLIHPDADPDKAANVTGHLLWGDGVRIEAEDGNWAKVRARGRRRTGWVPKAALGGKSLLEFYFIDVGQGDGVLIKTPDFRHIMLDGGYPRRAQNSGKSGADFVDWKFYEDYGFETITLDAMIASHNDYDHYGGLADLLDADQIDELDAREIEIERFFHAGLSWWKQGNGRTLGPTGKDAQDRRCFTRLLGDRASAERAVAEEGDAPKLQGAWGGLIAKVVKARTSAGQPTPIERISLGMGELPSFDHGDVRIKLLGPVLSMVDGEPALPKLGSDSKSTNGNSVLMRVDYGHARVLLTGDLNRASHRLILDALPDHGELACDVAKACHHGSEDISIEFLQAMQAGATVISSGDGEGHDHPRPVVVAASGQTGFVEIANDALVTPLVYSTELARSVSIGRPALLEVHNADDPLTFGPDDFDGIDLTYAETPPGAPVASKSKRRFDDVRVLGKLIYGLVNVRTDGERILCATMNEGDGSWAIKQFNARF